MRITYGMSRPQECMYGALRDLGRVLYSPNAAILRIIGNPRPYVALS